MRTGNHRFDGRGITTATLFTWGALSLGFLLLPACQPAKYRTSADKAAHRLIEEKQQKAWGRNEPFTIETPAETLRRRLLGKQNLPYSGVESLGSDQLEKPKHWPEKDYPKRAAADPNDPVPDWPADKPLKLTLLQALQVGAANSREYQTQKEGIFQAALDLDLEADDFRNTFGGTIESILSHDRTTDEEITGLESTGTFSITRRLKSGAVLTGSLAIDVAKLLSGEKNKSLGIAADLSVTVPLLRGAGRHIVTEPLIQAERNLIYAFWDFEQFRRDFVVNITSDYLSVLQQADEVENATKNYESQTLSARRARALLDEDRMSKIEFDQARQAELSAREGWISARRRYATALDSFKQSLGLPPDAKIELDEAELERLAATGPKVGDVAGSIPEKGKAPSVNDPIELPEPTMEGAGKYEIAPDSAIQVALGQRPDLKARMGMVHDAQRNVVVAADALKAGLDLEGTAAVGESRSLASAGSDDSTQLRFEDGFYTTGLKLDLPWERTAERNLYRDSFIRLEGAVRDVQELEDQIKFRIGDGLRVLLESREGITINAAAVQLAEQRVDSTNLSLEVGRPGVEIRDLLDAQADLLRARNALSSSRVGYRVAELELQRDMGVLMVNEKGLYDEYDPGNLK